MFSGRTLGKVPELKDQEGQGRKKWVKTLAPESGRLQHMLHLLSEALGQFFFFFFEPQFTYPSNGHKHGT